MTPETIRALLAGITAGEWRYIEGPENDGTHYEVVTDWDNPNDPDYPGMIADTFTLGDTELLLAAPGIARYALELAAEVERLRAAVTEARQRSSKYLRRSLELAAALGEIVRVTGLPDNEAGPYSRSQIAEGIATRALAPQPAPTDGAG